MINIGSVALDGTPRIVAAYTDKTPLHAIQRAEKLGLDIAEARIDQFEMFDQSYVLEQLGRFSKTPVIATIRTESEGGKWRLTESERLALFRAAVNQADALDVELSSSKILPDVIEAGRSADKPVIVSWHDFETTPDFEVLLKQVDKARQKGADMVKIATVVSEREHVRSLARLAIERIEQDITVIGMGSNGVLTRLLFPALGSLLTYSFLDQPTGPGQLHFDDTFRQLRLLYPEFEREKAPAVAKG
jgi:3-dehydroquinate dehydratase-1